MTDEDYSGHAVGDKIHIIFPLSAEQFAAINDPGVVPISQMRQNAISIPFTVVDRSHSYVFDPAKSSISLSRLTSSLYLMPESSEWEDVFRWIVLGVSPPWAEL